MALHETVLEELGLAPRWVRRGSTSTTDAGGEASVADEPGRPVEVVAHAVPDARREAAGAVDAPVTATARGNAETRVAPPEPTHAAEPDTRADSRTDTQIDDLSWFDDQAAPAVDEPAQPFADARATSSGVASIATLDWDALADRVAGCQACRLCEKRTNTVFGVGDREAEWMLIGEAPGENEDRQGEPFVGQAGKLLDNMLKSLALARGENVYIANVIKCRPPGNRNPEPDEVMRCEPYLQRQVALVKPKLIVALGRFAAQSLLRTDASISSLRGRVHEYEGVPVIVTYHPAYLLRSLQDKAKAWADLCLARATWQRAERGQGE